MKKPGNILLLICILWITGCQTSSKEAEGHQKIFTCAMHPQIIREAPGKCPICGMDLVEKLETGSDTNDTSLYMLFKPTNEFAVGSITTTFPMEKKIRMQGSVTGYISYNTQELNAVSAHVAGRIEKLYAKYEFQQVAVGDRLLDIFSNDLETEQNNLLFLLTHDSSNRTLIQSSENKLFLLGMTKEQLIELKTSQNVSYTIPVFSPFSGHLHEIATTSIAVSEMGASSPPLAGLKLKEGGYVNKGQILFVVYSMHSLWAILNIPANQISLFPQNEKIKLHIQGVKDTIQGKVDFIEPIVRLGQKSLSIRVNIPNCGHDIKVGALVNASSSGNALPGIFIPKTAWIHLGLNDIVFVKKEKFFKAKRVQLGLSSGAWTQVISGLQTEEEIATNSQFLMDSESFIKQE